MQKFRSVFPNLNAEFKISYTDKIFSIGSCFAQELSKKMHITRFNVLDSPFGICFNPLSLAIQLKGILDKKEFKSNDLVFHNSLYHSMDHHGFYSDITAENCLYKINSELEFAYDFLKSSKYLICTFGTAYYYLSKEYRKIVSNCHKLPAGDFSKLRTNAADIIEVWDELLNRLKSFNPELKIIFTISPVRYLKDGFIENSRSKSQLINAVEVLCTKHHQVHYFPAYEIFMDDLREYRFVKEDLVHPNQMAIDYIWKYFMDCYFSIQSQNYFDRAMEIHLLQSHKFLHEQSEAARSTNSLLMEKINKFNIDFSGATFIEH